MSRWRNTKKGKTTSTKKSEKKISNDNNEVNNLSSIPARIKAFITDTFLITTPIVYTTIYLLMGSGDAFSQNKMLGWLIIIGLHFIIVMTFWLLKGQTPGLKAYEGKIVDQITLKKISYLQAIVRYVITLLSILSVFGLFVPFLRKDKKTLQDLFSNSCVIVESSE